MSHILLENGQPIPLENGASLLSEQTSTVVIICDSDSDSTGYAIYYPQTGYFYNWKTGLFAYGFNPAVNVTKVSSVLPSGLFSTQKTIVIPTALTTMPGLIGSVLLMDSTFTQALDIIQSGPIGS